LPNGISQIPFPTLPMNCTCSQSLPFRLRKPLSSSRWILPLLAALFLAGCGRDENSGPQGAYAVSAVVAPVSEERLEEKILLVGTLEAIEEVDLISEVEARVEAIQFEEGESVEQGAVLIRLDDRKLTAAVSEMQARFNLAKANLERSRTLLDRETISEQDFDQAEAEFDSAEALLDLARERLADAVVRAPFNGVLTERLVSTGQFMTRGQVVASLVAVNPLEAQFNVPERYIGQIKEGQAIEISIEAFPDESFSGDVVFISPRVDRETRTVLVKAVIQNTDNRLKPGMFGRLELIFASREATLVIPEGAIQYRGDQASVVVMGAQGTAEFRNVTVGSRLADKAEILSGLEPGERVVVEGFQKMGPGTSIQISAESSKYGISADSTPDAVETAPEETAS